jgi:hypothetical protein
MQRKSEWYDLDDDFIDDRDLALDDRKTIAQTKQAGFYVSSGDVQLVRDKFVFNSQPCLVFNHPRLGRPLRLASTSFLYSRSRRPYPALAPYFDPGARTVLGRVALEKKGLKTRLSLFCLTERTRNAKPRRV